MKFSFEYTVDTANKLLICEVRGEVKQILDLEHLLKTTVKMAGKNQVKNVVVDITEFIIHCPNIELAKLLVNTQEQGWLTDMKIAHIIRSERNTHNVIAGLADKFELPIKNFETRSEAMLWLLFDKIRSDNV